MTLDEKPAFAFLGVTHGVVFVFEVLTAANPAPFTTLRSFYRNRLLAHNLAIRTKHEAERTRYDYCQRIFRECLLIFQNLYKPGWVLTTPSDSTLIALIPHQRLYSIRLLPPASVPPQSLVGRLSHFFMVCCADDATRCPQKNANLHV